MLADLLTLVTDAWTLDDNILLHQILTMMELKIPDFVLHCMTVKELWCFLRDLYGGNNNIYRAYDVIQELFWKKTGQPMDDHYIEFNCLAEELRQIFSITSDVKQTLELVDVTDHLGTLDPVYSSARLHIMGSSVVSSLLQTSLLKSVISEVTSDTSIIVSDQSASAAQRRQTAGSRGGGLC